MPGAEPGAERPRTALHRALLRFTVWGALALVLVSVATVLIAEAVSRDLALRHARSDGTTFARVVGGPIVDDGVLRAEPARLAAFTREMEDRLRDTSLLHIKVWARDGSVVWSDQPGMQGRVFDLEPAVDRLFSTPGATAEMSSTEEEDGVTDRAATPMLEVYASARSATGAPIVVETYWSAAGLDQDARSVMVRVAPLLLGALLLFAAVITTLAWALARRVDRAQAESKRSLQHALSAADLERRRIARDLHDGVMQDLSGAGYALSAVSRSLPVGSGGPLRLVDDVSSLVKNVGESLRSLMADIYPPNLAREGLPAAVVELAGRAADEGVTVDVEVDGLDDAAIEVRQLCYRVIREALRNVLRHADAAHAEVDVAVQAGQVLIRVADDGRGLSTPTPTEGHLGLRLLEDTLLDLGGSLVLEPRPGGGTVLLATVPVQIHRY